MIPDMTSQPIQKPRPYFCTDSRSTSLGVAEAGTLNLDLRALKSQNPIFFLEYLSTHYKATITIKTLAEVRFLQRNQVIIVGRVFYCDLSHLCFTSPRPA